MAKRRLRKPSGAMKARLRAALHADWRRKRAKLQRGRCFWCGAIMKFPTLDHVVPTSKGGADHWENTCASCEPCNHRKADMMPEEFAAM